MDSMQDDLNWEHQHFGEKRSESDRAKDRCSQNLHCEINFKNIYSSSIRIEEKNWTSVNHVRGRYKFENGAQGICIANNGSPLMCTDQTGPSYYQLVGVVKKEESNTCHKWTSQFHIYQTNMESEILTTVINNYKPATKLNSSCVGHNVITRRNEFPWMLAIFKTQEKGVNGKETFLCAATLISKQVALTAQHCLTNVSDDDVLNGSLIVRARAWKLYNDIKDTTEDRVIEQIEKLYDLPLTRLHWSKPLILDTIKLTISDNFTGNTCLAIGWGHYKSDMGILQQAILRKVYVSVMDMEACIIRIFGNPHHNTTLISNNLNQKICAGGTEYRDTCQSDGGGPLVCELGKKYVQIGVHSSSISCGINNIPSIYIVAKSDSKLKKLKSQRL